MNYDTVRYEAISLSIGLIWGTAAWGYITMCAVLCKKINGKKGEKMYIAYISIYLSKL